MYNYRNLIYFIILIALVLLSNNIKSLKSINVQVDQVQVQIEFTPYLTIPMIKHLLLSFHNN